MLITTDNAAKVYVPVCVRFLPDGTMLPYAIQLEDGHIYRIDRILDIRQAAAMKAGGQGDRYTISVEGRQSFLFFERSSNLLGANIGRWFVERKDA